MNRIRQLREAQGKPQKALAFDLGVSQATISDWESGRKVPSAKSTIRLAQYFKVSVEYLLGLVNEESPLAEIDEEALDAELIARLKALSPEDLEKVEIFVQWIAEARGESASPPAEGQR